MFFYMEEKTMKKRIISVLAFLLIVLSLTGCSTRITSERMQEFTQIAESIKNDPNYVLPDGFTFEHEEGNQNGRIVITVKGEKDESYTQRATFDITQEEVQLEKVEEDFSSKVISAVGLTVIVFLFFILIIGGLCTMF